MRTALRIIGSVAAAIVVAFLIMFIFGIIGGGISWEALDYFFPVISGQTDNTNTEYWGRYLLLPLAIAGGLVCGALVFDPKATRKTEIFITTSVFILLGSVSGVNFWASDTLININAQLITDIIMSTSGLALVGLLIRWEPSLILTTAVQRIAIFLVSVFGFSLPLYYAVSLLLKKFGYHEQLNNISDLTKFLTGAVGLVAAIAPSFLTRRKKTSP